MTTRHGARTRSILGLVDFLFSIPLYILWFVGDLLTRGAVSRAIARAAMNPPGMR